MGAKRVTEPVVLQQAYDLAIWYAERTATFPKAYRHTLADKLQAGMLGLVESLQDAAYGKRRADALERAQDAVDRLRLWNRMAKDLRCVSLKQYAYAAERIEEIGKQIGGWRKAAGFPGDGGARPRPARRELEQQLQEHPLGEPQQERPHEPQQQRGGSCRAAQASSNDKPRPGPVVHGWPGAAQETTTPVPEPRGLLAGAHGREGGRAGMGSDRR
jgi:hypothetical protein